MADAGADQDHEWRRPNAERKSTEARTNPRGHSNRLADALYAREQRQEPARQHRDEHCHERIPGQMRGNEGVARRVSEERRLSQDGDEDGVRNDTREQRWNQRIGFEIVSIQDLDSE